MKRILEILRLVSYLTLVVVDGIITVMSMSSLGHNQENQIGLGIIGAVIVLLATWVFLTGIRAKGIERWIRLGTWGLSVVLVVSLNWSFTRQNLFAQTTEMTETESSKQLEEQVRRKSIESTQKQIDSLLVKLDTVNVWREQDRAAISADIEKAKLELSELMKPIEKKTEKIQSLSVFRKMGAPVTWTEDAMADLWWILAFLALQLMTVIAAPKAEEDTSVKPIAKKDRAPLDWTEHVKKWVWANWIAVRNPARTAPFKILTLETFDDFIKARWHRFPKRVYNKIIQAAQSVGAIDGDEIRIENEEEVIKKILDKINRV